MPDAPPRSAPVRPRLRRFSPRVGIGLALALMLVAPAARADDTLRITDVLVDRPTLHALGVQVLITDDDDRDATITVRIRETGGEWRAGPPLFRVHPETVGISVPEQLAGSVFDLVPGTQYEIELHATDPDGAVDLTRTVMASTRPVPRAEAATPRMRPVATSAESRTALGDAMPGDVIVLANGTYDTSSAFSISRSGTAESPIVIRGESQDGVVLDGGGCDCNVVEVYGSFVHVERMTIRNAFRALRFQGDGTTNAVARRLTVRDVVHGIASGVDQRDFYFCDNDLEGRLAWPWIFDADWTTHWDDRGIWVAGEGHVVCHNRVVGFGDAIINLEASRSYDFYGNDIQESADATELDRSIGNVRFFANRMTNVYAAVSLQPVNGGPTYVLRNVGINVTDEALKLKMTGGEPSGALVYHNTFLSPELALTMQTPITQHNFVIANNLFIGPAELAGARTVDWTATIDDGVFDYNGYFPDGSFWFGRVDGVNRVYSDFAAAMASGDVEAHGVLVAADVLASGAIGPSGEGRTRIEAFDAALASGSRAIDAAMTIPGINSAFAGDGPDIGARESGCPAPIYGPRPAGTEAVTTQIDCRAAVVMPGVDGGVPGGDAGVLADAGGSTREDGGSRADGGGASMAGDGCGCRAAGRRGEAGGVHCGVGIALALIARRLRRRRARGARRGAER